MISLLISFLIFVLILSVVWWILTLVPLPEPIRRVVPIVFVVICLIALLYWMLPLARWP